MESIKRRGGLNTYLLRFSQILLHDRLPVRDTPLKQGDDDRFQGSAVGGDAILDRYGRGVIYPTGNHLVFFQLPALADQFTLGLGRPVSYYAMPPQKFGSILSGIFGPEGGAAVASEYQKLWDNPTRPVMYAAMEPVLATLPVRLTTVREWVAKHASAFSQ